MQSNEFLLYGANGYTGQLIAKLSATYSLRPVLAGRNEKIIRQLAEELQLPYLIIDLHDTKQLQSSLAGVKLVLHAAGPFQITAKPMIDACIATHTHYIDITGEIPVFEMAKRYNDKAVESGIMLMPGVGFDVVPTDCMALFLKNILPDATQLQLAFASAGGSLSHGTATTMVMGLGEGGAVRENGEIVRKPLGHKGMWIDLSKVSGKQKKVFTMTIPWGDISTAHFTTGIPNIETYTGISPKIYLFLKFQRAFNWLLKTTLVRNYAIKKINKGPAGPADETRAKSSSLVWGKVINAGGKTVQAAMRVKDGYTLTAHSSLLIVQKILAGNIKTGYQTPAAFYGEDLVLEIPGTKRTPAY
ncbi:MAG: saccharopine dehydrogenase NADP-binding domain-containing protein [Ferruginibacter sp.]|nr:saccharopine dehydrogenase NADP-binding domain-containing protein [Ferruginibacter sp.]